MNILDVVPAGAKMKKAASERHGPCPWCGGDDRFVVMPGKNRYWCRVCGRNGDVIQFLRDYEGMSYPEAAAAVGKKVRPQAQAPPRPRPRKAGEPPPLIWQQEAGAIAREAAQAIFTSAGAEGLAYLRGRGLTDETIRAWRLGYLPQGRKLPAERMGLQGREIVIPAGVLVPHYIPEYRGHGKWVEHPRCLYMRRQQGKKAHYVRGSKNSPVYPPGGLRGLVVIVEGAFDAASIWQEAQGLPVTALATGSTGWCRGIEWSDIHHTPGRVIAFDSDEAGDRSAKWWVDRGAVRWRPLPGQDPNDMLLSGTLRPWLEALVSKHGPPQLPTEVFHKTLGQGTILKYVPEEEGAIVKFPHRERPWPLPLGGLLNLDGTQHEPPPRAHVLEAPSYNPGELTKIDVAENTTPPVQQHQGHSSQSKPIEEV